MVGRAGVITDADDLVPYNSDWLRKYPGDSRVVVLPSSTEEVQEILRYCHQRRLPVVPQGGNTGLVGGGVALRREVVLSLRRMQDIHGLDRRSGVVRLQAGVTLQQLQQYCAENGHTVPLDLGAKGTCQLGGNASTCAGGLRLVRWGTLHGSVCGATAVLADGRVLRDMRGLRKDNTGFHLRHLLIGSEGALGVITELAIACPPLPRATHLALLGVSSFERVLDVLMRSKQQLGEILSAFEFFDSEAFSFPIKHCKLHSPLQNQHPFYCLIETQGSNEAHDMEVF